MGFNSGFKGLNAEMTSKIKFWGKLGGKAGDDVRSQLKKKINREHTEQAENYLVTNLGGCGVKQLTQRVRDVEKEGKKQNEW